MTLRAAYESTKARARAIAGEPADILPRVRAHREIYLDSNGNHAFPLIALHGALWGYDFFETTGKLGELISYRYFLDAEEKEKRLAMLNEFARGFKAVNREVFIDTYTNYHFTKEHGRTPGADEFINPELLAALNEVHAAAKTNTQIDERKKKDIFLSALRFEQEITVAPGIERELAKFDCPILRALCMKPIVRFAYFPILRTFYFRDFSNKDERIDRAVRAFDIAAYRGWTQVLESVTTGYGASSQLVQATDRGGC